MGVGTGLSPERFEQILSAIRSHEHKRSHFQRGLDREKAAISLKIRGKLIKSNDLLHYYKNFYLFFYLKKPEKSDFSKKAWF